MSKKYGLFDDEYDNLMPKYKLSFKPKIELPKIELPKIELPKIELPKIELPKIELPKPIDIVVPKQKEKTVYGIGEETWEEKKKRFA